MEKTKKNQKKEESIGRIYYTPVEAAKILGRPAYQVRRVLRSGKLPRTPGRKKYDRNITREELGLLKDWFAQKKFPMTEAMQFLLLDAEVILNRCNTFEIELSRGSHSQWFFTKDQLLQLREISRLIQKGCTTHQIKRYFFIKKEMEASND